MKGFNLISSSNVIGDDVKNTLGENLGKIEDIMIDSESGRIAYVVLSFGGFLGFGDKYFAIPWESFRLSPEENIFYLDVPREKLENAPSFSKDDLPNQFDSNYVTEIYNYYGCKPFWD